MALIEDLRTYLVGRGVTTPIQLMVMADSPNECIALADTGGFAPDDESPLRDPTVQVLTRAGPGDYPKARALANQVFNLLHNTGRFLVGAAYVYECAALQEPTPIGQDSQGRWKVTCNYHFKIRE